MNKVCRICNLEKDISLFNKNILEKDNRDRRCKECTRERDKVRYKSDPEKFKRVATIRNTRKRNRNRVFISNYLKSHSCIDCGEDDFIVLEFDHVRGIKKKGIGDLMAHATIKVLQEEIDKCEVRCANCHRRKTAKQFGWYKILGE